MLDLRFVRPLVHDEEFVRKINNKERAAWLPFIAVIQNCKYNKMADNYEILVTHMLLVNHDFGHNMSVKLHFLNSHIDQFPEKLKAVSNKQ